MKSSCSIHIEAPPERVFRDLSDPEKAQDWVSNLVEDHPIQQTENHIGDTFRQTYDERGKRVEMTGTITAYEQDKRLAIRLEGETFNVEVDYWLDRQAAGTELTQNVKVEFQGVMKWVMWVVGPLMGGMAKKQALQDLEKFKAICEASE